MKKIEIKKNSERKIFSVVFIAFLVMGSFAIFPKEKEAKILFVGDMMFDRQIRKIGYTKGEDFVFSCIGDFLKNSDLVVGNLEGPITENPSISMFTTPGGEGNYTFTFPTNTAKLLAKNNIKLVSLGNNHIGNFGLEGLDSTKNFLSEAGVDYFGGFGNDEKIFNTKINNYRISFIAFNEFGNESPDNVAEKIRLEREKGNLVLVYAHWGDEYVAPPQRVKNIAKKFADSGADFIIGSHPHVILENEKIDNVPVYYSLGNFIFDQYFNKEVSTGLVLELNIKDKKISVFEHEVSISRDGRTCLQN